MTRYTMQLILERWVTPYVDTSSWEYFDMSCKVRDDTNDQVLHDAVAAGAKIGAIFKEPTITPTATQREQMGLKKVDTFKNGPTKDTVNSYMTILRTK
jgi:isocitrate dehydrogenase